MTRVHGLPPTCEEIERIARARLAKLADVFARHVHDVLLRVEDFADDDTLAALGITDPFELTGVYEGVPLREKDSAATGALPDRIRLFRQPMLDEWLERDNETLEHLVEHVLIHEVGHHFGLSDADIHALENAP